MTVLDKVNEMNSPLAPIGVPPFPAVALKALKIVADDRSQFNELNELLRTDAALSSEILRIANSALYGIPEIFESLSRATVYLGLERIRNVILTVSMRNYFGESAGAVWVERCWRYNLVCALIAEELTRKALPPKKISPTLQASCTTWDDWPLPWHTRRNMAAFSWGERTTPLRLPFKTSAICSVSAIAKLAPHWLRGGNYLKAWSQLCRIIMIPQRMAIPTSFQSSASVAWLRLHSILQ